jgi:hypothetical protein
MLRFPQHSHDEEARWSANQVSFVQADRVDPPNVLNNNHVTEATRPELKLDPRLEGGRMLRKPWSTWEPKPWWTYVLWLIGFALLARFVKTPPLF